MCIWLQCLINLYNAPSRVDGTLKDVYIIVMNQVDPRSSIIFVFNCSMCMEPPTPSYPTWTPQNLQCMIGCHLQIVVIHSFNTFCIKTILGDNKYWSIYNTMRIKVLGTCCHSTVLWIAVLVSFGQFTIIGVGVHDLPCISIDIDKEGYMTKASSRATL